MTCSSAARSCCLKRSNNYSIAEIRLSSFSFINDFAPSTISIED